MTLVFVAAISALSAWGGEAIRHLLGRLNDIGVIILFSAIKRQVIDVLRNRALRLDRRGPILRRRRAGLEKIYSRIENIGEDDPMRLVAP